MTYKDKLLKIFEKHGTSEQLKKLSEEIYELQEAITRYTVGADSKYHIELELADVMVLLNQIMHYFKLDSKNIKEVQKFKIDRQCQRDNIYDKE